MFNIGFPVISTRLGLPSHSLPGGTVDVDLYNGLFAVVYTTFGMSSMTSNEPWIFNIGQQWMDSYLATVGLWRKTVAYTVGIT